MSANAQYLFVYTIYRSPSDYPGRYVVRRSRVAAIGGDPSDGWTMDNFGVEHEIAPWFVCDHLVQAQLSIPSGNELLNRYDDDDPAIVEVWL
jgi:hypothetical protein